MSIPISKDRGIDPHLTYCPRCGGEANELTLGVLMKGLTYDGEVVAYANRGKTRQTERELAKKEGAPTISRWEEVTDTMERIPAHEPCDKCKEEIKTFEGIVAEGGIYFVCEGCGKKGVIRAESGLAKEVREHMKIAAPDPCGIKLEACWQHGEGDPPEEILST